MVIVGKSIIIPPHSSLVFIHTEVGEKSSELQPVCAQRQLFDCFLQ